VSIEVFGLPHAESGVLYAASDYRATNYEGNVMAEITVYSNTWCCDCRRAKSFLKDRGIAFREINIDHNPEAEATVLRVNNGKRKVPTIEIEGRYFPMSPFDPCRFAEELKIPLNK